MLLRDLKILITRPIKQATKLALEIKACGGQPICFPTLEIVPTCAFHSLRQSIKITTYDFILFISPSAVLVTADFFYNQRSSWPNTCKIIALGPGTAAALRSRGLPVHFMPEKDFHSLGLLNLSILHPLANRNILLVKGVGGSSYLEKSLKTGGAFVKSLKAYKRQLPKPKKNSIPPPQSTDIILCTSKTGLKNLVHLLYPNWKTILFKKQLLVISHRLAKNSEKLGFVKPALIADNASNAAVLQSLISWKKEAHGIKPNHAD